MGALKKAWTLLEAEGLTRYYPEFRDEARRVEGLGCELAAHYDGDVTKLLLACAAGLEDWNWHEDAQTLRDRAAAIQAEYKAAA